MKKFICLFLAALYVFLCLTGCTGNGPEETSGSTKSVDTIVYTYPSEVPTYADDKELSIVAFWAPPNTEEWYQSMVDSGFTHVIIDARFGNSIGSETLFDTLALCDQVGIGAYLAIRRESQFYADPRYSQYESFVGVNVDEPLSQYHMDCVLENLQELKSTFADAKFWLGIAFGYPGDFITFDAMVEYYMDNGGTDADYFSIAPYPLGYSNGNGNINKGWLQYMEQAAAYAKEYDTDMFSYLAGMSIRSQSSRRPDAAALRYTSYVPLAYGATGIGYFCYTSPGFPPFDGEFAASDYALVNFSDVDDFSTYYKTEIWYDAKTVNEELKGMDQVILSFDWQGVMKSAGSDAQTTAGKNCFPNAKNWLRQHDGVRSFTSTEDAIMGVFRDENGYDGFMLVNFADTLNERENTVTLEFRGATRAVAYIKGEQTIVELNNGVYEVTLQPGEGQFIIPIS